MNSSINFDWREYQEIARLLSNYSGQSSTPPISAEAFWRAAISRAYYGAFNIVCEIGIDRAWFADSGDGNMHTTVIEHLQNSRNPIKATTGNRLDRLRRNRNRADYRGNIIINGQDCVAAIKMAYAIIQDVPNLPP